MLRLVAIVLLSIGQGVFSSENCEPTVKNAVLDYVKNLGNTQCQVPFPLKTLGKGEYRADVRCIEGDASMSYTAKSFVYRIEDRTEDCKNFDFKKVSESSYSGWNTKNVCTVSEFDENGKSKKTFGEFEIGHNGFGGKRCATIREDLFACCTLASNAGAFFHSYSCGFFSQKPKERWNGLATADAVAQSDLRLSYNPEPGKSAGYLVSCLVSQ